MPGRDARPISTRPSPPSSSEHGAIPLFKNYPNSVKGKPPFPAVICASVNEQVVHGIPNRRPLQRGGHRLDRHRLQAQRLVRRRRRDPAPSAPIRPELQKLLDVTSETLDLAIRAMGRCRLWSEVATLMEQYVKSQGMYVIEKFVGHGIGQDMHEEPQVPNFVSKALRKNDIRLEPGIVLAIEPMVAPGDQGRPHPRRRLDRRDQGPPAPVPTSSIPSR